MDIIYCAGGNTRLARIAMEEGFLYGARSDDIRDIRCDGLIDVNWKRYNWELHLETVAEHRPKYAVVPDVMDPEEVQLALRRADELAKYCRRPILVPKSLGVVARIPVEYVIGVSVPTKYAGFLPKTSQLVGREVHLLGGSPGQQRELWQYYTRTGVTVISTDLNSHNKASDFGSYWNGFKWCDDERASIGKYKAFRKSCQGIMLMWRRLGAV
jgi:hypothetical protein